MKMIVRLLCKAHNFLYFLIGQFAIRENQGIHPKHEIMKYHDFFVNNISPTDTVLDIGCGQGFVAASLAEKARSVVGIDISSKNIADAKEKFQKDNLTFQVGDATTYDFRGTFDAIVLSNVLEHVKHRALFLKKISPLSKKFLIRVPMIDRDWLTLYKKKMGVDWRLDDTHFTEYTMESFRDEIEEARMSIGTYSIQFGEIWAVVFRTNTQAE